MPTSSIFDKFVLDTDEKLEILLRERDDKEKIKTPKIDIDKRIKRGREVLENF
jgi:hypothetical protein